MANSNIGPGSPQIALAEVPDFDLGGLRVTPARREVEMDGHRRELEPRVAQVLVALASVRPAVVSRDRLIELCWGGRVVGDDSINRCIVALRHLAKDFSPKPFAIETIPRVGYSLVEHARPELVPSRGITKLNARLALAGLAALLIVGALAFAWSGMGRPQTGKASIAVLSFRNLSEDSPFFAEGISEEVLGQLSRDPRFRVAGGASAAAFGKDPDVREVGQRLDVDYVVEGSVRRQGDAVRVSANLVRADDRTRLWSDSYDGNLNDIFAIQQRIGTAIAGALRLKLVPAVVVPGTVVKRGEAYNLYLTARGLIRTHNRRVGGVAANLLRDALKIDPNYAPAWAGLARATLLDGALGGHEGIIAVLPHSRAYAQRSLRLAPEFGEGHRTLGTLLGYGSPEAQHHLRRAAQLDPNSSEILVSAGVAESAAGNFGTEIANYRRAREIDPMWFRTVGQLAVAYAEMGSRQQAEEVARRGLAHNPVNMEILLSRVAAVFADYSETVRLSSRVLRANSPRWNDAAQRNLNDAKLAVGLSSEATKAAPGAEQRRRVRVWMTSPPDAATWQWRNRHVIASQVYRDDNHVAAKLMLNAGRYEELTAIYDGPVGLLTVRAGQAIRVDQLHELPTVFLALRHAGRTREADRLLQQGSRAMAAVYRRGRAPFWFDADAAGILAVQGQNDKAFAMLERAFNRGWRHAETTGLISIGDEPAFRALRTHPRFVRLQSRLSAHLQRERAETAALGA